MTTNGWIALPRDIEYNWIWLDARRFQMWLQLIFSAAWDDGFVMIGNKKISIKRGQFVTSVRRLMSRWHCSSKMTTSFIRILEEAGMITRTFIGRATVITIINYDKYQPIFSTNYAPNIATKKSQNVVRQLQQIKKNEEEQKANKNFSNFSKEKEQDFFNQAIASKETFDSLSKILKIDFETLKENMTIFFNEVLLSKKPHGNTESFILHFRNWCELKKKKRHTMSQSKKTQHDTNNSRRGNEISNLPNSRYNEEEF
jgi:hypothetical protein